MAVRPAGSLEAVATDGGFIRELAPSRGMHGASADRAAPRSLAKLPPHSHHNRRQNHSQAERDAEHHHRINSEGRDSNRHRGSGWRWCRHHWGGRGEKGTDLKYGGKESSEGKTNNSRI